MPVRISGRDWNKIPSVCVSSCGAPMVGSCIVAKASKLCQSNMRPPDAFASGRKGVGVVISRMVPGWEIAVEALVLRNKTRSAEAPDRG